MAFEPPTEYNSAIMVNKSFQIVSPTVAELTEANPILTYNSNLAQTAAITATTQANVAATSAQTAQQAAEQATEISDPEGWRTNTRAMISDLATSKSNIGTLYIGTSGGCFKNTTTSFGTTPARSMCVTFKFDKDFSVANWASNTLINIIGDFGYAGGLYRGIGLRITDEGRFYLVGGKTTTGNVSLSASNKFPFFFGGTSNQVIPAGIYTIVATVVVGETSTLSQIYVNGALKEAYTATGLTTSLFNAGVGFDVCTVGNSHGTDFSNGCFSGGVSRVMAFNFDMSASNAPYTVADYQSGKPIPPSLCSTTATQRSLVAFANYTIARNSTTRLVKDISGKGNDATVTGDVMGDRDLLISTFVDEIKTQISQNS